MMRLLMRLLPFRDITKDGTLYMRRFYLIRTRWFSLFLHYLARGDADRDLHDHPWNFAAMLLSGSYIEEEPIWQAAYIRPQTDIVPWRGTKTTRRWPFMPRFKKAEALHRLHLNRPIWTLFAHGTRRREWGFQTPIGWVPWQTYVASNSAQETMNG